MVFMGLKQEKEI